VATGYVVPQRKANISPRIGRRWRRSSSRTAPGEGGQVIAVLEDADYGRSLAQAQAEVKAAQCAREAGRGRPAGRAAAIRPRADSAGSERLHRLRPGPRLPRAWEAPRPGSWRRAEVAAARAAWRCARGTWRTVTCARRSRGASPRSADVGEIVFGFTSAGNSGQRRHSLARRLRFPAGRGDVSSRRSRSRHRNAAETVLDAFPTPAHYARRWRKSAARRPRQGHGHGEGRVRGRAEGRPARHGRQGDFPHRQLDEAARKRRDAAVAPDAVVDRGETKARFRGAGERDGQECPVITGRRWGTWCRPPRTSSGTRVVRSPPADLKGRQRIKEKH